mgnify:CR=1 FL=1
MARRRKTSARRNLILVGLLAGVCLALAALLHLLDLRPPALADEWQASRKALMQDPDDNAFNILVEAERLLPRERPKPKLLPHPGGKGRRVAMRAGRGTIGRQLRIDRPDEDPELRAYLESCKPAFDKARSAIGKPCFQSRMTIHPRLGNRFDVLTHMALYGKLLAREPGGCEKALPYLLDAAALASMVVENNPYARIASGDTALEQVSNCAWAEPSGAWLEETARRLRNMGPPCAGRRAMLLSAWTDIDRMIDLPTQNNGEFWSGLSRLYANYHLSRVVRAYAADRERFLELVERPIAEMERQTKTYQGMGGPYQWLRPDLLLKHIIKQAQQRQWPYWRAVFAVALERFQRDHGNYPEGLDALVPQYVEAIPRDLMTGAPLHYRRLGKAYVLYALGLNGKDQVAQTDLNKRPKRPLGDDILLITPQMLRERSGTAASGADNAIAH